MMYVRILCICPPLDSENNASQLAEPTIFFLRTVLPKQTVIRPPWMQHTTSRESHPPPLWDRHHND